MTSNKHLSLIVSAQDQKSQEVVLMLMNLLKKAEKGEFVEVFILAENDSGEFKTYTSTVDDIFATIGKIEVLKNDLLKIK